LGSSLSSQCVMPCCQGITLQKQFQKEHQEGFCHRLHCSFQGHKCQS
jgi:hypothetical protein